MVVTTHVCPNNGNIDFSAHSMPDDTQETAQNSQEVVPGRCLGIKMLTITCYEDSPKETVMIWCIINFSTLVNFQNCHY